MGIAFLVWSYFYNLFSFLVGSLLISYLILNAATHLNSIKDIKLRVDAVKVVAVTCLGINSPLLAHKRFDVCIMDEAGQTTLPVCTLNASYC